MITGILPGLAVFAWAASSWRVHPPVKVLRATKNQLFHMFHLFKSFLATCAAWGVTVMFWVGIQRWTYGGHFTTTGLSLLFYSVGIVVFPSCMLVVTPLLARLPSSSPLWRPLWASLVGAIAGPPVLYLWVAGYFLCIRGLRGGVFLPELHDVTHLKIGSFALVAGVVFAWCYAILMRRGADSVP